MRIAIALLAACLAVCGDDDAEKKAKEALDAFVKAYHSKDEGDRVAAVNALAGFPSPGAIQALATVLSSDTENVRVAAAQTLGKYDKRKDVAPVLAAALDPNKGAPKVYVVIVTALGGTADPAAIDTLSALLHREIPKRDKSDLSTEGAAVAALQQLRFKPSVDALIDLLHLNADASGATGKVKASPHPGRAQLDKEIHAALKKLTGQSLADWRAWEDWWKASSAKLDDQLNPR